MKQVKYFQHHFLEFAKVQHSTGFIEAMSENEQTLEMQKGSAVHK